MIINRIQEKFTTPLVSKRLGEWFYCRVSKFRIDKLYIQSIYMSIYIIYSVDFSVRHSPLGISSITSKLQFRKLYFIFVLWLYGMLFMVLIIVASTECCFALSEKIKSSLRTFTKTNCKKYRFRWCYRRLWFNKGYNRNNISKVSCEIFCDW